MLPISGSLARVFDIDDRVEIVVADCAPFEDGTTGPGIGNDGPARANLQRADPSIEVRYPLELVPDDAVDPDVVALAKPSGSVDDGLEHGRRVGRPGGDDVEDRGRGGHLVMECRLALLTRSQCAVAAVALFSQGSVPLAQSGDLPLSGRLAPPELQNLGLKLRDPRVAIVRHHGYPGPTVPLRDGARIARALDDGL